MSRDGDNEQYPLLLSFGISRRDGAWYVVIYKNGEPWRFKGPFPGGRAEAEAEALLAARIARDQNMEV